VKLKNETQCFSAQTCKRVVIAITHLAPGDFDAAGRGRFEQTDDIEQRAFTGPGRPNERSELARHQR